MLLNIFFCIYYICGTGIHVFMGSQVMHVFIQKIIILCVVKVPYYYAGGILKQGVHSTCTHACLSA